MARDRILLVTDEMEVGGSQRQIAHLLGGLDRARWQPELLYFRRPSFLVDEIRATGVRVHHLPKRGRIDPRFLLRYAALLRGGHYQLVHAFSLTAELWTTLACALVRRPPRVIASVRGLYLDESPRFWRLKRFVAGRSTAVIANARACAAAAAAGTGLGAERFEVVPNGVDLPAPLPPVVRAARRDTLGVPRGRPFGLFVGRLVAVKNLPCLVRALARIPPPRRPWIAVAGDGPLRRELEDMAHAAGLQADLVFLGERADATAMMQAADFLLLTSWQEGMSNAVLEAMAAGCAVIASAVGGNRELVEDGRTGLLFDSDDDRALARCMEGLCGDPERRARLSTAAREQAAAAHAIPAMVAGTAAVYERCRLSPPVRDALRRHHRGGGDGRAAPGHGDVPGSACAPDPEPRQ